MKPGLAVLPLEVWADVFVFPWITRKKLARYVRKIGDREFAEKLQFRLHDMGKHTLRYLDIRAKYLLKRKQAELIVSSHGNHGFGADQSSLVKCKFPETEMPVNIRGFKRILIRHFDHRVVDFLDKIKPLFTDVLIGMESIAPETATNMRILFTHLLPMVASIRGIRCNQDCIELLEAHFPGTLARAKELDLNLTNTNTLLAATYLNWLNTPQNTDVDGPRFLKITAKSETISAIVVAVREQFLATTASSTFVIFLEYEYYWQTIHHTNQLKLENAATNEQLAIRNAVFDKPQYGLVRYVEILRHSMGAETKMREWIEQRAYYEMRYVGGAQQLIWIRQLTIGRITKKENKKAKKHITKHNKAK